MGSSKIKAQGQSQSHVNSAFNWYFLKKTKILSNTDCLIWYVDVYI